MRIPFPIFDTDPWVKRIQAIMRSCPYVSQNDICKAITCSRLSFRKFMAGGQQPVPYKMIKKVIDFVEKYEGPINANPGNHHTFYEILNGK